VRAHLHRTLAALVALAAGIAAHGRPDFSGQWEPETRPSEADVPLVLTVRQTVATQTVRGDAMTPIFRDITIERQFASGTQSDTHVIGVQSGKMSGRVGVGETEAAHTAVRWDGTALVFEGGTYTGSRPGTGTWTERREVWSLHADGRLRVAISIRSSSGAPSDITLVYRRRQ
jgi:hypothetical protein